MFNNNKFHFIIYLCVHNVLAMWSLFFENECKEKEKQCRHLWTEFDNWLECTEEQTNKCIYTAPHHGHQYVRHCWCFSSQLVSITCRLVFACLLSLALSLFLTLFCVSLILTKSLCTIFNFSISSTNKARILHSNDTVHCYQMCPLSNDWTTSIFYSA